MSNGNSLEKLVIGTRGSPLALAQANEVRNKILSFNDLDPDQVEIEVIKTSGDKFLNTSLSKIGGKGLFTKEIQQALIDKRIDIAVHSMKDVETELPEKLFISTILEREDVRDSFISRKYSSIAELPMGSVVGTSSLRRKAQLLNKRNDLEVVEFRGNVQKRLEKLDNNVAVATFLATAGLNRLGLEKLVNPISTDEMLPAVAQGAVGIEHLYSDKIEEILAPLNDRVSKKRVDAERAFLRELDGSCRTPIGGLAQKNNEEFKFMGEIISADGKEKIYDVWQGDWAMAEEIGREAGREIKSRGGKNFFQ
ncbi:hydroxymethylbilane synthase [Paracoccaceae bacterium]|nr:hydroxymethylbilane synthase [Paracoccaceae bacterium]